MGLFQSKWYKMARLVKGNVLTLQKIRPNQNRILLMMFLNLMFCLDFASCLFNQRDVITWLLSNICAQPSRESKRPSNYLEIFAKYRVLKVWIEAADLCWAESESVWTEESLLGHEVRNGWPVAVPPDPCSDRDASGWEETQAPAWSLTDGHQTQTQ